MSSALEEMVRIAKLRFPPEDWNIYAAQASDGDNSASDTARSATLLQNGVLPLCQYFAYLEVGRESESSQMGFIPRATELWRTYEAVSESGSSFAMCKVNHRNEIYQVFRRLFERKASHAQHESA